MDDERWQALVRRLEPQARARPVAYRRKVVLLAILGYAFIASLLLVLFGFAAVVVYLALTGTVILLLKLLIPIGGVFFVIARSLYVKFEPPGGVRLKRDQVPELFRMIEDVRRSIQGPQIHEVRVNGDTNAGVVQVPRRAREELGRRLLVGRRPGRRVDDAFDTGQGARQAVAAGYVDAA